MAQADLHVSARRKYEADDRRILSVAWAKKGKGLDVTIEQLNPEEGWDRISCDRHAEPHEELVMAINAFGSVVQQLNELPDSMSESIVINGVGIGYTKGGVRRISVKASRQLSDGHLLPNNSRPVAEPPSDVTGNPIVFFPKEKLSLLEDLRIETLTYIDGTQGMIAPAREKEEKK
jgi:hypothetical protein